MRLAVCVAIFFLLAACSDLSRTTPVANQGGAIAEGKLHLEVAIGENKGMGADYEFDQIKDVHLSRDANIWIIDGGDVVTAGSTPRIRRYSPQGEFLGQVGKEGLGPGEYNYPDALAETPDGRIALRDYAHRGRINFYRRDGSVDTTWNLGATLTWPANGRNAIQFDSAGVLWLPFILGRPSRTRPPPRFLRVSRQGLILDTLPTPELPNVEHDSVPSLVTTLPSGGTLTRGFSLPYQPSATWGWHPDGYFVVGRSDIYRIDYGGRSASRDLQRVVISEEERIDQHRAVDDDVKSVDPRSTIVVPAVPAHKPYFTYFNFSDDGQLVVWASMPSVRRDTLWIESRALDVFDRNARFRGRIVLPESFTPDGLRGDTIWGVFRGADDILSVRKYRIEWRQE